MMNKAGLSTFSREKLVSLAETYSRLISALDGLWFLAAEKDHGYEAALRMDVDVWQEFSDIEARRIASILDASESGISRVISAFKLRATFISKEFEVTKLSENKAKVRITRCRTLESMERAKRKVFPCAYNAPLLYPKFAKGIDPNAKLRFTKVPPRTSPQDSCCEWELEV